MNLYNCLDFTNGSYLSACVHETMVHLLVIGSVVGSIKTHVTLREFGSAYDVSKYTENLIFDLANLFLRDL